MIFSNSLQLIFLSILQGITEFLPVSSSGHLILFSKFTEFPDQGVDMDVALHVGSVIAIMLYFMPTILEMLSGLWKAKFLPRFQIFGAQLFYLLIVATLPIVVCGLIVKVCGTECLRSTKLIGWNILIYGIILWFADSMSLTARKIKNLEFEDAILIGFAQCLSLLPGTSRAGVTMTMCRFLGLERQEAAKFSMLMAIPAIIAAGGLSAYLMWHSGTNVDVALFSSAIGCSFVFSMTAIVFLMFWLKNRSFLPFILYRIVLGILLLVDAYGIYDIKALILP